MDCINCIKLNQEYVNVVNEFKQVESYLYKFNDEKNSQIKYFEENESQLLNEIKELKQNIDKLRIENNKNKLEINKQSALIESLKKENDDLVQSLTSEQNFSTNNQKAINDKVTEYSFSNDNLKLELSNFLDENRSLKSEVTKLKYNLEFSKNKFEEQQLLINDSQNSSSLIIKQLNEKIKLLKSNELELTDLNDYLSSNQTYLENQLTKLKKKNVLLEQSSKRYKLLNLKKKDEIAKLNKKIKNFKIKELRLKLKKLKQELLIIKREQKMINQMYLEKELERKNKLFINPDLDKVKSNSNLNKFKMLRRNLKNDDF
jgi:chromosome segregation protein